MATVMAKAQCSICQKETSTFICQGCSQSFCWTDLNKHRQSLGEQLDHIETDHDQLRQKFIDQKTDVKNHLSIQQIDQWEKDAIQIIKQTAEQCRQKLINYVNKFYIGSEYKLNDLARQIKDVRERNEFNEMDLKHLKQKLKNLEEPNKLLTVSIKQQSTSFNNNILLNITFNKDTKWKQDGITIVGENGQGNRLNQLHWPRGMFIDDEDQTLYIADSSNHRILEWKFNASKGRIVAGGHGEGNEMNQLNSPNDVIVDKDKNSLIIADRKNRRVTRWSRQNNTEKGEIIVSDIDCRSLAMDKDGSLYVCDCVKNEVKRWKRGETNGTLVAGGNGEGDQSNQLHLPTNIFVDVDYTLYISDSSNHRVMKWLKDAKEGILVAGGNGQGSSLTQLSYPQGVIVDEFDKIYVTDWDNHRVICWHSGATEGTVVVGGNGDGQDRNQFKNTRSLSLDREGNLYVIDCNNDRIQKFELVD